MTSDNTKSSHGIVNVYVTVKCTQDPCHHVYTEDMLQLHNLNNLNDVNTLDEK